MNFICLTNSDLKFAKYITFAKKETTNNKKIHSDINEAETNN